MIVDADLSQIEWRVCAELTNDEVMKHEICEGRDQHAFTCTNHMELPLTKDNRTDAKIFNFRAIYADPASAAYAYYMDPKMPNFSQRKWDKILEGFFGHYNGMVKTHGQWVAEVRKTGRLVGPTGRIWNFQKEQKRGYKDYKATKIYNYPVQGTSGDMIKLAIIKIRNQMMRYKMDSLMVNTVHDSIIFDAPEREVQQLAEIAITTFRSLPELMEKHFNWTITVPIDGEVEYGPSWGNMKELVI